VRRNHKNGSRVNAPIESTAPANASFFMLQVPV
jgi:hypothetical protein